MYENLGYSYFKWEKLKIALMGKLQPINSPLLPLALPLQCWQLITPPSIGADADPSYVLTSDAEPWLAGWALRDQVRAQTCSGAAVSTRSNQGFIGL